MEAHSDAELLARASTEPELFGVVFDRHFATIHRYLERRIGRDGADELSGEVFRIAFEQRARFRPVHESALPWLYGLDEPDAEALARREGQARAVARLEAASQNGTGAEPDGSDDRIAATLARVDIVVLGMRRPASLADNGFFYELPHNSCGMTTFDALLVTLRDGSVDSESLDYWEDAPQHEGKVPPAFCRG